MNNDSQDALKILLQTIISQYQKAKMRGTMITFHGFIDSYKEEINKLIDKLNINNLNIQRNDSNDLYWLQEKAKRLGVPTSYNVLDPTEELTQKVAQSSARLASSFEYLQKVQEAFDTIGLEVNNKNTVLEFPPYLSNETTTTTETVGLNYTNVVSIAIKERYPKNSLTSWNIVITATDGQRPLRTCVIGLAIQDDSRNIFIPLDCFSPARVLYELDLISKGQGRVRPVTQPSFFGIGDNTLYTGYGNIIKTTQQLQVSSWKINPKNPDYVKDYVDSAVFQAKVQEYIDEINAYLNKAIPNVDKNVLEEVIEKQGNVVSRQEMPPLSANFNLISDTEEHIALSYTRDNEASLLISTPTDNTIIFAPDLIGTTAKFLVSAKIGSRSTRLGVQKSDAIILKHPNGNAYCTLGYMGARPFNSTLFNFNNVSDSRSAFYADKYVNDTEFARPYLAKGQSQVFTIKNPFTKQGNAYTVYNNLTPEMSIYFVDAINQTGYFEDFDQTKIEQFFLFSEQEVFLHNMALYAKHILPYVDSEILERIRNTVGLEKVFDVDDFAVYDASNTAQSYQSFNLKNSNNANNSDIGNVLRADYDTNIIQIKKPLNLPELNFPYQPTVDYFANVFSLYRSNIDLLIKDVVNRLGYYTNSISNYDYNSIGNYSRSVYPSQTPSEVNALIDGKQLALCSAYDFYKALLSTSLVTTISGDPFASVSTFVKSYIAKMGTIALFALTDDTTITPSVPNPDSGNFGYQDFLESELLPFITPAVSNANYYSQDEYTQVANLGIKQVLPRYTTLDQFKYLSEVFTSTVLSAEDGSDSKFATQFDLFKNFSYRQYGQDDAITEKNITQSSASEYLRSKDSVYLAEAIDDLFLANQVANPSIPQSYYPFYDTIWNVDIGYATINLTEVQGILSDNSQDVQSALRKTIARGGYLYSNSRIRVKTLLDEALYVASQKNTSSIITSYGILVQSAKDLLDINLLSYNYLIALPTQLTLNQQSSVWSSAFRSLPMKYFKTLIGQNFLDTYQSYTTNTMGNFAFDNFLTFAKNPPASQKSFKILYDTNVTIDVVNNTQVQYYLMLFLLGDLDNRFQGQDGETWSQIQTDPDYANARTFINGAFAIIQPIYNAFKSAYEANLVNLKDWFVAYIKRESTVDYIPTGNEFTSNLPTTEANILAYFGSTLKNANIIDYIENTTVNPATYKFKFIPIEQSTNLYLKEPSLTNLLAWAMKIGNYFLTFFPHYSIVYPFQGTVSPATQSDIGVDGRLYNDVLLKATQMRLAVLRRDDSWKSIVDNYFQIFNISIVQGTNTKKLLVTTDEETRNVLTYLQNTGQLLLPAGVSLEIIIQ